MAAYEEVISTPYSESGDDVYAKPLPLDRGDWPGDTVDGVEEPETNVYEVTLDGTKAYIVYLSTTEKTFTADAGTDVITCTTHGLLNGQTVRFKGTDLPAGIVQSTLYYVRDKTDNTFKIEETPSTSAVDITDAGTGTMILNSPEFRNDADQQVGAIRKLPAIELTAEAEETIVDILNAIQAKTDLIGTGNGIAYYPYSDNGYLLELIIGDDYLDANDRALVWTFDEIAGITTSAVGRFGLRDALTGEEVYVNATGVVTEPSAGNFQVSFDIPNTALLGLTPGEYDYSTEVTEGGVQITISRNRQNKTRVKLVEKYTYY